MTNYLTVLLSLLSGLMSMSVFHFLLCLLAKLLLCVLSSLRFIKIFFICPCIKRSIWMSVISVKSMIFMVKCLFCYSVLMQLILICVEVMALSRICKVTNNPLNLVYSRRGISFTGCYGCYRGLLRFVNLDCGLVAAIRRLHILMDSGIYTSREIIRFWSHNMRSVHELEAYERLVQSYTGMMPDDGIIFGGIGFANLVCAMAKFESGLFLESSKVLSLIRDYDLLK